MNKVELQINDKPTAKHFKFLESYSQVGVLVDENTESLCYPHLKAHLPKHHLITVKSGEHNKNLKTCYQIWEHLTDFKFDRNAVLVNVGGGVIGDMGGFVAGTFKRGIQFVQLPTTLLSQVDASIGGKLGIDFKGYKNQLGLFSNPTKILIFTKFLSTLPERELRSGFAEVLKHILIADGYKWQKTIEKDLSQQDWKTTVAHSVHIKSKIVNDDPFEKGVRKILNFGHTIGHAVESFFMENESRFLLHGEAVAIGMICESYISHKHKLLSATDLKSICDYIKQIFGKHYMSEQEIDQLLPIVEQDKKNEGGEIRCTLLKSIGNPVFNIPISLAEAKESLLYYNDL